MGVRAGGQEHRLEWSCAIFTLGGRGSAPRRSEHWIWICGDFISDSSWSTSMTKIEALELINGVRISFLWGMFINKAAEKEVEALRGAMCGKAFGFEIDDKIAHALDLSFLANVLGNAEDRRVIIGNLGVMLRNDLVRMSHEIACMYTEDTGQFDLYRAQPWFQFARVLRNVVSHKDGALLRKWPPDLKQVHSVTWRTRSIFQADVGKHVYLQPAEYVHLHEDIAEFLRTSVA
jgi:hypothetical protein